ncbi:hypothetical protein DXG01_017113 [Tephrocybe rancida]|nr:hypothetical protein DXG01_017113 [Tephrocybe rancida]
MWKQPSPLEPSALAKSNSGHTGNASAGVSLETQLDNNGELRDLVEKTYGPESLLGPTAGTLVPVFYSRLHRSGLSACAIRYTPLGNEDYNFVDKNFCLSQSGNELLEVSPTSFTSPTASSPASFVIGSPKDYYHSNLFLAIRLVCPIWDEIMSISGLISTTEVHKTPHIFPPIGIDVQHSIWNLCQSHQETASHYANSDPTLLASPTATKHPWAGAENTLVKKDILILLDLGSIECPCPLFLFYLVYLVSIIQKAAILSIFQTVEEALKKIPKDKGRLNTDPDYPDSAHFIDPAETWLTLPMIALANLTGLLNYWALHFYLPIVDGTLDFMLGHDDARTPPAMDFSLPDTLAKFRTLQLAAHDSTLAFIQKTVPRPMSRSNQKRVPRSDRQRPKAPVFNANISFGINVLEPLWFSGHIASHMVWLPIANTVNNVAGTDTRNPDTGFLGMMCYALCVEKERGNCDLGSVTFDILEATSGVYYGHFKPDGITFEVI